jgi:hypothetical protein
VGLRRAVADRFRLVVLFWCAWRLPVPARGPFIRAAVGVAVVIGGALALAGGLALRGPGLTAVVVAGLFAACLCAAIAHEEHGGNLRSSVAAGAQAGAWTVAGLLAVAGTAGLAGGVIAALVAGTAVMGGAAYWLVRASRAERAAAAAAQTQARPRPTGTVSALHPTDMRTPVPQLSTRALGQEWVRTSAVLAGRLDPSARAALVLRRQEALDELERRDPVGFARWMLAGPVPGSDPADYVQGDRTAGTDAA